MNAHTRFSRNLALIVLPGIGILLALSLYFKLPLELALALLAACGISLYVVSRLPEVLLLAVMFAPQWKTYWPLSLVDRAADLTLLSAVGLAVAIAWRLLSPGYSGDWNLRRFLFQQQRTLLAYMVFALVVTLSYSYTTAPNYGLSKLTRFLFIGTLLLLAPCFLILSELDLRRFAAAFLGFSAITSLELIAHVEVRTDPNADITRIGAGWLVGMATIVLLFYPIFRGRAQTILVVCLLPILTAGLIASATRGAIVSLIPATMIGAALWFKQGRLRMGVATLLLALLAVSAAAAYYVLRQADSGKYSAKASELVDLLTGHAVSGSAGKRLPFYETALRAIPDHLWLGRGIGSWGPFYFGTDERNYPHDLFLELLFEEGMLGLTAFLALLLSLAVSSVWMLKTSRFHFLAVPLLLLYAVNVSMFSGDLDDNRLIWLWAGMTLAACRMVSLEKLQRSHTLTQRATLPARLVPASIFARSRNTRAAVTVEKTGGVAWR